MKKVLNLIIIIFLFTGCNQYIEKELTNSPPEPHTENSILVYDPWGTRFISYNLINLDRDSFIPSEKEEILSEAFPSRFQYRFNNLKNSPNYIHASSIKNHVKIVNVNKYGSLDVVFEFEDKERYFIFPLAISDGIELYMLERNLDRSTKTIASFDGENFTEFENVNHEVYGRGLIFEDYVYYTVFDFESESYFLYKLDFKDYKAEPILVEIGLSQGDIYLINNKIYRSNGKIIYYDEYNYFDALSETFFYEGSNVLVQVGIEEVDGRRFLRLTDTKTREYRDIMDFIGFNMQGSNLIVYSIGNIETIDLENYNNLFNKRSISVLG